MAGASDVLCSICFKEASQYCKRSVVTLKCSHEFHLDCIGSYFNDKGSMQCPNCQAVEKGEWRQSGHHNSLDNVVNNIVANNPGLENRQQENEEFPFNGLSDNQGITDYPLTMVYHYPFTMGNYMGTVAAFDSYSQLFAHFDPEVHSQEDSRSSQAHQGNTPI